MENVYRHPEEGRMKVFFVVNEEGDIRTRIAGNQGVVKEMGIQFYVDEHVGYNIDDYILIMDGLKIGLQKNRGDDSE